MTLHELLRHLAEQTHLRDGAQVDVVVEVAYHEPEAPWFGRTLPIESIRADVGELVLVVSTSQITPKATNQGATQ